MLLTQAFLGDAMATPAPRPGGVWGLDGGLSSATAAQERLTGLGACDEQVQLLRSLEAAHLAALPLLHRHEVSGGSHQKVRGFAVQLVWTITLRAQVPISCFFGAMHIFDAACVNFEPEARDLVLLACAAWTLCAKNERAGMLVVEHTAVQDARKALTLLGSQPFSSQDLRQCVSRLLMSHGPMLRMATVHTWVQIMMCRFDIFTDGDVKSSPHAVSDFVEAMLERCVFSLPASAEHTPQNQGMACLALTLVMAGILPPEEFAHEAAWARVEPVFQRFRNTDPELHQDETARLPVDLALDAVLFATQTTMETLRGVVWLILVDMGM